MRRAPRRTAVVGDVVAAAALLAAVPFVATYDARRDIDLDDWVRARGR